MILICYFLFLFSFHSVQAITINVPKGAECVTEKNGDETTVHIYPYGQERKQFNNLNENKNENCLSTQNIMQAEIQENQKGEQQDLTTQKVSDQSQTTGQLLWIHAKDAIGMLSFFAFAGLVTGRSRDQQD